MPRRRHIAGREPIFAAVCVRSFSHGLEETLTAGPFPHLVRRTLCIASEEACLGTQRRKRAAIWVEKRFEETKKPPPSLPTILPLRQFFCLFVWFTFPTFSQRSQKKKKKSTRWDRPAWRCALWLCLQEAEEGSIVNGWR